jgi:hypothetical protein
LASESAARNGQASFANATTFANLWLAPLRKSFHPALFQRSAAPVGGFRFAADRMRQRRFAKAPMSVPKPLGSTGTHDVLLPSEIALGDASIGRRALVGETAANRRKGGVPALHRKLALRPKFGARA